MEIAGVPAHAEAIRHGPASRDPDLVKRPRTRQVVIDPSDRVRVETVPDSVRVPELLRGKVVGSIDGINATSLTIVLDNGQPAVIHRDLVARMDLRIDKGSRWKHGAISALIFGATGALLFASVSAGENQSLGEAEGSATAKGAALFASVGLLIGLLGPAGESWKPLPKDRVSLSEGQP
jgi:hypothetical protein